MQYLVTGGTGFIGSHLIDAILKQGDEAVILSSSRPAAKSNRNNATVVSGDIADITAMQTLFHENSIDGVFHMAAMNNAPLSLSQPKQFHDVNITGTLNILIAARDAGVKNIVLSSSALVYGKIQTELVRETDTLNPLTPYAVSKVTGEMYCRMFAEQYGMHTASLRYFNTYGPRQDAKAAFAAAVPKFADMIVHHTSPTIFGTGEQARDFVYVKDVAQANILAMKKNADGIFNIGSGVSTSLNTIAQMIMDISGTQVEINYQPARQEEVKTVTADITKAQKAFGYNPEYSIHDGLQETVRYFMNQ